MTDEFEEWILEQGTYRITGGFSTAIQVEKSNADELNEYTKVEKPLLEQLTTKQPLAWEHIQGDPDAPPWQTDIVNMNGAERAALTISKGITCEE